MSVLPRSPSAPRHVVIMTSVHDPFDPRIFHKQAKTLAAAGYRVTLLAAHPRTETVAGVRLWGIPPPRSRAGRPLVWVRLLNRALRLRADLYHFHDPELLPLGLLLARLTGRPVIYDAHEYYRDEIATRPWIPRPLRRPVAETVHAVESFVARRLAATVAVNEHMAAGFRARGARSVAVHNYPAVAAFGLPGSGRQAAAGAEIDERGAVRSNAAGPESKSVVYIGLLTRDRGLGVVWQAGQLLRALLPEAVIRVTGRVDWSEAPAGVPREPERWRVEAAVDLIGVIPAGEVPAALRQAATGWVPFQPTPNNRRTIPLKLLEYMAVGLPVVASDFGYLAGIVGDAGCGLLVPADDAGAHARALAFLLTHPQEARAMGERGRLAVQERYTWEAESSRLIDLYRWVMGACPAPSALLECVGTPGLPSTGVGVEGRPAG